MTAFAKLQAISDNPDICTGLALTGVLSRLAYSPDDLRHILENIAPDIGLVIITSGLAAKSTDILDKHRKNNLMPLITIIPDLEPRSAAR